MTAYNYYFSKFKKKKVAFKGRQFHTGPAALFRGRCCGMRARLHLRAVRVRRCPEPATPRGRP